MNESLAAGRRAVALAAETTWSGWAAETLGWTLLDLRCSRRGGRGSRARSRRGPRRSGLANEIVRCMGQLAWARCLLGAEDEAGALAARAEELLATGHRRRVRVRCAGLRRDSRGCCSRPAPPSAARLCCVRSWRRRSGSGGSKRPPSADWCWVFAWRRAASSSKRARRLPQAAAVADEHGIPAPGWEAHAALARLGAGATHTAAAEAIVERMAAALNGRGTARPTARDN